MIIHSFTREDIKMRYVKFVSTLLVCMLFAVTVSAQGTWDSFITGQEYTDYITDMASLGEYLWCGTAEGVVRWNLTDMSYDHYTMADGLPSDFIINVEIDQIGNIWLGTYDSGICRYDWSTFTTYSVSDGLADDYAGLIVVSSDGTIWAGSSEGISRFDGDSWTVFDEIDMLNNSQISAMAAGPDGSLWFGTYENGLISYEGESYMVFTEDDGLSSNTVISLEVATDGTVWAGGLGGGVSCWNGEEWTILRDDQESDAVIQTKLSEAKNILRQIINLETSYYEVNGEYINFDWGDDCPSIGFAAPDKSAARFTYTFIDSIAIAVEVVDVNDDGDTEDGLTLTVTNIKGLVDGSNVAWEAPQINITEAKVILRQIINLENSYFNTNGEYIDFDSGEDCVSIGFAAPDAETARFKYAFVDSIAIAVEVVDVNDDGDTEDGLTLSVNELEGIVAGSNINWESDSDTEDIPDYVWCFAAGSADGSVWAGTVGSGVLCYNEGLWQTFTTDDGLPGDEIHAVLLDSNGVLWCGTEYGLCRYTEVPTSVDDGDGQPEDFPVITNYPNPFNPHTAIRVILPENGMVNLAVYTINGQRIRTLAGDTMHAGTHTLNWDGADEAGNAAASGVYLAVLKAGKYSVARKMQLMR